MTSKNMLRAAAETLPGHWMKRSLQDYNGNRCVIGHLRAAYWRAGLRERDLRGSDDYHDDLKLLAAAARDKFPDRVDDPGHLNAAAVFNDHSATTEADVLTVLELAADRWDAERGEV